MIRKILFFTILLALAVALFFNPNFKTIAAGVAILLRETAWLIKTLRKTNGDGSQLRVADRMAGTLEKMNEGLHELNTNIKLLNESSKLCRTNVDKVLDSTRHCPSRDE